MRYGKALFSQPRLLCIPRIDPENAVSRYTFGEILKKQKKMKEAFLHFAETIRINPDYADAYNQVGVLLYWKGKIKEAEVFF